MSSERFLTLKERMIDDKEMDDYNDRTVALTPTNPVQSKSFKLKASRGGYRICTLYNLSILLVAVILTAIGLAVGLTVFFVIKENEFGEGLTELSNVRNVVNTRLNDTIYGATRMTQILSALFSIKDGKVDFYDEFLPFMTTGNVFVPGVSGLQFNAYITEAERPAFVKSIRDMGRDFTNFTMLDRDADNNLFPTPPNAAPYYCVIVHSAPLTDFLAILGYNVASSPYEVDEVFKSKTQGVDTCTRTFMLVENQRGFIYYSPIYTHKNHTFVGLASGVFHVKPLFDEVKEESVALFAFDRNLTKTDTDYFIYSSLHDGQINGYSKNVTNVTAQEIIRKAPYLLWDTVRVADRIWDVAYVPSSGFLYDFDGWEKWIALFGSLITAVFIVLLSTIFIKRIEHGQVLHQLSKERVLMLQESEIKLTKYLDLIANKERESRLILDAIPDYIIIVDGQGQIKLANQTFDKVIKVKKDQGIMVSTLLPKLAPDFFLEGYTDQVETEFKKLTGSVIPVIVSVRVLDSGSFMIIVRSVAEKKTLEEQLKRRESQVRRMQEIRAFDDRMMSEEFRTQFKDFCKREKNDENIDFIAAVNEYKSQSAKERIEMQHEILQTFINEGSSRELNIDKELRKEIEKRVGESVGDVSVFDKVVETIKTTIILDILPRYSNHRRKSVVTK